MQHHQWLGRYNHAALGCDDCLRALGFEPDDPAVVAWRKRSPPREIEDQ